jgi:hypothetical protein
MLQVLTNVFKHLKDVMQGGWCGCEWKFGSKITHCIRKPQFWTILGTILARDLVSQYYVICQMWDSLPH